MVRWNELTKINLNARKTLYGKEVGIIKLKKVIQFIEETEKIADESKKLEAFLVRICLEVGKKVELAENGEIHLYFSPESLYRHEKVVISQNEELYALLRNLYKN